MKNIAVNALNYTGIVTLSQYMGDQKITIAQMHNTGGGSLFNFLASCLAGDFRAAQPNRPTKIRLLSRTGEKGSYYYSPVTSTIFLRTPPEPSYTAGESRVRFSFIVPRDFLEAFPSVASAGTLGIGLYANSIPDRDDSEAKNFMAFCALDEVNWSALVNTFLVVDWDLIISNLSAN